LVEYEAQAGNRNAAIAWARKLVAVSSGDAQAQRMLQALEQGR